MTGATTVDEGYDDGEEPGLSGFWILVIFLAVLAVFAGIVYVAYQKGLHANASPESELPLVVADPEPVRKEIGMEPADPGRPEVDEELNDPRTSRVVAAMDPDTDPLADYADEVPSLPVANDPAPTTLAQNDPEPQRQPEPAAVATSTQDTPVAATATPTVKPEPKKEPTPAVVTPPVAANATHSVQVGAFGSKDEAMEFYGSLMRKIGPLVGDQRPEVRVANVKGKEYHRLWLGAFPSREDANAYCEKLSAKGQACYVQKR